MQKLLHHELNPDYRFIICSKACNASIFGIGGIIALNFPTPFASWNITLANTSPYEDKGLNYDVQDIERRSDVQVRQGKLQQ